MLGFAPDLTAEILSRLARQANIENNKLRLRGMDVVRCNLIKGGDSNVVAS